MHAVFLSFVQARNSHDARIRNNAMLRMDVYRQQTSQVRATVDGRLLQDQRSNQHGYEN